MEYKKYMGSYLLLDDNNEIKRIEKLKRSDGIMERIVGCWWSTQEVLDLFNKNNTYIDNTNISLFLEWLNAEGLKIIYDGQPNPETLLLMNNKRKEKN